MVVRKTFNPKSRSDVRGWVTLVRWRWCSHRWGRWKYNEYHHRFESCPDYKNIDSGIPHSTDVDNLEWNRNSWPSAEASLKLRKQLRLEREGYSITINNIVLFHWERNYLVGHPVMTQHRGSHPQINIPMRFLNLLLTYARKDLVGSII